MGYKPRVIPCLLLDNGRLVKTIRFSEAVYIGDPINTVRVFNDLKADELVFLDISASSKNQIDFDLVQRIGTEAYMPFSYGGGITNLDQAAKLIANGAEKLIVGSALFTNPDLVEQVSDRFGSQAIAVCLDYRTVGNELVVFTNSGKRKESLSLLDSVKRAVALGAGEIILSAIEKDGTQSGYDLPIVRQVAALSDIPVIALGGAGENMDFKKVTDAGASAAAAGAMFCFMGSRKSVLINYPDQEELSELFSINS